MNDQREPRELTERHALDTRDELEVDLARKATECCIALTQIENAAADLVLKEAALRVMQRAAQRTIPYRGNVRQLLARAVLARLAGTLAPYLGDPPSPEQAAAAERELRDLANLAQDPSPAGDTQGTLDE